MILNIIITLVIVALSALVINAFEDNSNSNNDSSISITQYSNVPIIAFEVDGKTRQFIIDTGASYSMIDSTALKDLSYNAKGNANTIYGINGDKIDVNEVSIKLNYKLFSTNELFYNMDISEALKTFNEENDTEVIGFIGGSFLQNHNCTVCYATNKLTWCKILY